MSKVIITIEDAGAGEIEAAVEFDPPVRRGEMATPAQAAALQILDVMGKDPGLIRAIATEVE